MNLSQFEKLPYYQSLPKDGRPIIVTPYYIDGKFTLPIISGDNIVVIDAAEMVNGHYFSKRNENTTTDIFLSLFDTIAKRLTSENITTKSRTIESKIVNLGIIIEKYSIISTKYEDKIMVPDLLSTEMEFLFGNVRSLFDQLQKIIALFWRQTLLINAQYKKKELPPSFRDIVLTGEHENVRTKEEIVKKYGLPLPIAEYYQRTAPFFRSCKMIRENIVHFGESMRDYPIYQIENKIVVDSTLYPYSQFNCWKKELLLQDKFGSLRTLIAFIVGQCLETTKDYVTTLYSCVQLPDSISSDWYLFLRHPLFRHFHRLSDYIDHPWD